MPRLLRIFSVALIVLGVQNVFAGPVTRPGADCSSLLGPLSILLRRVEKRPVCDDRAALTNGGSCGGGHPLDVIYLPTHPKTASLFAVHEDVVVCPLTRNKPQKTKVNKVEYKIESNAEVILPFIGEVENPFGDSGFGLLDYLRIGDLCYLQNTSRSGSMAMFDFAVLDTTGDGDDHHKATFTKSKAFKFGAMAVGCPVTAGDAVHQTVISE